MPSEDSPVRAIFEEGGILSLHLTGYEFRASQLQMALAVEEAMREGHHLAAEAGTGTGKTLAYLVPGLLSPKRVIISTATKTLQDQLVHTDVPFLKTHLAPDLRVVCMKGRANYLCLRRLKNALSQPSLLREERDKLARLARWSEQTDEGERSQLTWLRDDDSLWENVDARSDACTGQACSDFQRCFVTRMRQRAFEADLIVVNHALLFSTLAIESDEIGRILPDSGVLILDEAHQVEDVVAQHFGRHLSNYRFTQLIGDLGRVLPENPSTRARLEGIQRRAKRLFEAFPGDDNCYSLNFFPTPEGVVDLREELASHYAGLRTSLRALEAELQLLSPRPDEWEALVRRVDQLSDDLDKIFGEDDYSNVYWFEKKQGGVFLHTTPIQVSSLLREKLFDRNDSVVLTSATLTAGGDFGYLRRRLGVDEPVELQVESEFDHATQSILFLARHLPEPRHPAFLEKACQVVLDLIEITEGHAFLLCTSFRNMHGFFSQLGERIPYPLLRQGERPRHQLLATFKRTPHAVLCATSSFWEGVDVKGDALRLVIIDKLPFRVPTEPVVAARLNRIREEGGDPFLEYTVPEAIITLKQGLGRLIRSKTDRGILAVLDSRICTRRYGDLFVRSLPNYRVTDNMQELRNFFPQGASKAGGGESS